MGKLNSVCLFMNESDFDEIKAFVPQHVEEMICYLNKRGYDLKCFKELNSSRFILKFKNICAEFKNCKEVCDFLKNKFYTEKQEEVNEIYKKMLSKCLEG